MMPVIAVGLITEPYKQKPLWQLTKQILWQSVEVYYLNHAGLKSTSELNEQIDVAPQYLRSAPHQFKHLFK